MRRIFHWPLFTLLAVLHLAVLPLILTDPEDVLAVNIAGAAYIALALADRLYRPSPTRN